MSDLSGDALIAELSRKKNDTIRVHNITKEEYILEYDKAMQNTAWTFPPVDKDSFGIGKGNRDVPRYIADRFMEKIVDIMINEDAKKEWAKKKKSYGTRDDIHRAEERHIVGLLRDESKRDVYRKQIWLGLVRRNGDSIKVNEERPSRDISATERLGLDNLVIEQNMEDIIGELSEK